MTRPTPIPLARVAVPLRVTLAALHRIAAWDSEAPTEEARVARAALAELQIFGPPSQVRP